MYLSLLYLVLLFYFFCSLSFLSSILLSFIICFPAVFHDCCWVFFYTFILKRFIRLFRHFSCPMANSFAYAVKVSYFAFYRVVFLYIRKKITLKSFSLASGKFFYETFSCYLMSYNQIIHYKITFSRKKEHS